MTPPKIGANERLGATLAVYDNTKTNVLTASDVPGYSVAAGEIRSTGFEADFNGLVGHWRLTGNFEWMDARVTKYRTLPAGTSTSSSRAPGSQPSRGGSRLERTATSSTRAAWC